MDDSGGVALTGHLDGLGDFGGGLVSSYVHPTMGPTLDIVIAAYTSSGAYRWSRVIGSDSSEEGKGIATDSFGNVLVTGYQASFAVDYGGGPQTVRAGMDVFVAKYSSAGSWVWSRTMGGSGTDQGLGIAADGAGNTLVTGYIGVSATGVNLGGTALFSAGQADGFLAKYSPTGAHLWSQRFGSTGNDMGTAVAADSLGNIYVGGTFEGTVDFGTGPLTSSGLRDIFVVKYNSSTAGVVWARKYGSTGDDMLSGIALDSAGDVAIAGKFQGSVSFGGATLTSAGADDAFVAKITGASAAHSWSRRFGAASGDLATGVAVDGSNNVVLAGYFAGSVDFGGGLLTSFGVDIFTVKFNSAGTHLWSKRIGSGDTQISEGVAVAPNGDVTIVGFYGGSFTLGLDTLFSAGGFDGFIGRVSP